MTQILGHYSHRNGLKRLFELGSLPNTMMLAGPSGIGKRLVANELAKSFFCEKNQFGQRTGAYGGCGNCTSCNLFEKGNIPDYQVANCKNSEEINVSAVRNILDTAQMKPFWGKSKVVLLDHAEDISLASANLLLKVLEEPLLHTYFILVCSNPSKLPRTLLSRCQIWYFDQLTQEEVKQILTNSGLITDSNGDPLKVSSHVVDQLALICDGSLENLGLLTHYHNTWKMLKEAITEISNGEFDKLIKLKGELPKERESLKIYVDLMRIIARQNMLSAEYDVEREAWAICLTDLLCLEELAFKRYVNGQYLLVEIFLSLAERLGNHRSLDTQDSDQLLTNLAV